MSQSLPRLIVIPERPFESSSRLEGPLLHREVAERLSGVARDISSGKPLGEVLESVLGSISELFRVSDILLEVMAEDVKPVIDLMAYGYPQERAEAVSAAVSSYLFHGDGRGRLLAERFKVCRNGYYLSAEERAKWEGPARQPPYRRHPERPDGQRIARDQFTDSDYYVFVCAGPSDEPLAMLGIGRSLDERLLTKEQVQAVGFFADMVVLAVEAEGRRLKAVSAPIKASQKTVPLEDVLKIASSIVSERDLRKLSDMILASVASLFGFGRVSLAIYDEAEEAFKWMALHGYADEIVPDTRFRQLPLQVVLGDLQESKRVGKFVYLTTAETLESYQLARQVLPRAKKPVGPRNPGEWLSDNCLAFALHSSTGRLVGVIYASDPEDGKLPQKDTLETMEVLTSLAEIAIDDARLSSEREQALRTTSQRTEQLSRILDLTSSIMYVGDLDQMLSDLLKTLARLLGLRRMVIGLKREDLGFYKIEAVYGYSTKAAEAIKALNYPIHRVDSIQDSESFLTGNPYIRWRKKVGRMTYYMPVEGQVMQISPEEMAYYPEPDLVWLPRRGKDHWHERDWMDTIILDRSGSPVAYLEILKPRDERIPDAETIEVIEIFANLAGIAIENARTFQNLVDSRKEAELYADVLSHDIKNFNQAILGYLDLLRMRIDKPEAASLMDKVVEQVMSTSRLSSNVRTLSRMAFGETELAATDIGAVLNVCERSLPQYYPGRKIVFVKPVEQGVFYTMADDLVGELFTNILTNAVKYDHHDPLEIDVSVERSERNGRRHWLVSIADHGRGVPDDVKAVVFDRFSKAPGKKGEGMGLHIVKTLTRRYRGNVWVEDRVAGDHAQGAVFKIELPAAG